MYVPTIHYVRTDTKPWWSTVTDEAGIPVLVPCPVNAVAIAARVAERQHHAGLVAADAGVRRYDPTHAGAFMGCSGPDLSALVGLSIHPAVRTP